MSANLEFLVIFEQFRTILKKYEKNCVVEKDTPADYYLNSKKLNQKKKPVFFAGTSITQKHPACERRTLDTAGPARIVG